MGTLVSVVPCIDWTSEWVTFLVLLAILGVETISSLCILLPFLWSESIGVLISLEIGVFILVVLSIEASIYSTLFSVISAFVEVDPTKL